MKYPVLGVRFLNIGQVKGSRGFAILPIEAQCEDHRLPLSSFLIGLNAWSMTNFKQDWRFEYEVRKKHIRAIQFRTWKMHGITYATAWRVRSWGNSWRADSDDPEEHSIHFIMPPLVDLVPLSSTTVHEDNKDFLKCYNHGII